MGTDQKRALLAIVLSGIVLFGWQFYFSPKKTNQAVVETAQTQAPQVAQKTESVPKPVSTKTSKVSKVSKTTLKNESYQYSIGNDLSMIDANEANAKFTFADTMGTDLPVKLFVIDGQNKHAVNLAFTKSSDKFIEGYDNNLGIRANLKLEDNGMLDISLSSSRAYNYNFVFSPYNKDASGRIVRELVVLGQEVDRFDLDETEVNEKNLLWFGIDYNYHFIGTIFSDKTLFKFSTDEQTGVVDFKSIKNYQNVSFKYIFTDKAYDRLVSLGNKLELSVDYGVFGILAVPILKTLQFIHKYIPNYGVAIIILTLILRLLLYPLQVKSFKSMKKMQLVQPEVKLIKEKYKDDPKRQQQETMALFKRAGANPLGGCLPLLLQMPFFFAIFQVLRNSIELVDAPFMGWITDLSVKDPYYVLPILMCLAMLVQQKVTPSPSADPAQKKMMMIMPLVFGFIMKDLPSGLCLYIFISTLFGFAQQMLVYKFSN